MNEKTMMAAGLMTVLALAPVTQAGLLISNGDFEADAVQTSNVTGWYDTITATPENWWESTWAGPTVSPNGTSVLGLSYMFDTPNWAYQSIGVNDGGLTSLEIEYDIGTFTDTGALRDVAVTWGVYSVDGTYAGGADNADIDGAVGATLVDTFSSSIYTFNPGGGITDDQTATFDISGTSGSELYLRVINVAGVNDTPWTAIDNLSVVPEPATFGLVAFFGAGVLFIRRRFMI